MSRTSSAVLLWLLVINLGIAFGAGLYEHRIVVPHWLNAGRESGLRWDAEAARLDDTGRRFWLFTSTGPLTLLTLGNIFVAWQVSGSLGDWWLGAALAALADRVFTFTYFIPTMVGLMRASDRPESVATATRWHNLNYLRHAIVLAAWLAALNAFALFYQQAG
jgi:hypothetical protein